MLDLSKATITNAVVHFVGNKANEDGVFISKTPLVETEQLRDVLQHYFLKPFKQKEWYRFSHPQSLQFHETYHFVRTIFHDVNDLYSASVQLAEHLYNCSTHPNIKQGELYVAHFIDCELNGEAVEAMGLFKSEDRDTYLKVFQDEERLGLDVDTGIHVERLDKGVIVLNVEEEEGYRLYMVDRGTNDAHYWKDEFLQLIDGEDDHYYTKQFVQICSHYGDNLVKETNDFAGKVQFLNNTLDYLANNEEVDIETFAATVIPDEAKRESFKALKDTYKEELDIAIAEQFNVSAPALKRVAKAVKDTIKLDSNVTIHIDYSKGLINQADMIEKGYDGQKGMNYYKVYYYEEK